MKNIAYLLNVEEDHETHHERLNEGAHTAAPDSAPEPRGLRDTEPYPVRAKPCWT